MNIEKLLIEHCSPTLASLKTANLFSVPYAQLYGDANGDADQSNKECYRQLANINQKLRHKGITLTILKNDGKHVLIYAYRRAKLAQDLQKPGVFDFMKTYGYQDMDELHAIKRLRTRFEERKEFPHEIGLFLGYPLGDVIGYIENAGQNTKCAGCWKVYCNECETMKLFARFKKCKTIYERLWKEGIRTITELTVAVSR